MTTKRTIEPAALLPGSDFHWLASGITYSTSVDWLGTAAISRRGQTVTISSALLAANLDTLGASFFDLIDSTDEQIEKFGRIVFARGPAPEGIEPWDVGSPEHAEAREQARQAAHAAPTTSERAEQLRAVTARYGAAPTTSKTILNVTGDDAS